MTAWYTVYDGVFFLGIATTFAGLVTVVAKSCTSSRCERCSFCYGALNVERNVELERDVEISTVTPQSPVNNTQSNSTNNNNNSNIV